MIITSIHGLDVKQIDPFFRTLRNHYDGDVVVIVGSFEPPVLEYLKRMKAGVFFTGQLNMCRNHWNNFRFVMLDYLLDERMLTLPNDSQILLSDCRDVIFQCHPFDIHWLRVWKKGLHSALENCCFRNSRANFKWLLRSCGIRKLWKMRDCRVSCAGTIIGDSDSIRGHVHHIATSIRSKPFIAKWSGLDQALHNSILWDNPDGVVQHYYRNWQSPFLTLDSEVRRQKNDKGQWINNDDSVIPIIHQWDRI